MKNGEISGGLAFDENEDYPLKWLDQLITVSLNPDKVEHGKIDEATLETISQRLSEEEIKLQLQIKSQVFTLGTDEEIGMLIRHYHSSIVSLLDYALENRMKLHTKNGDAASILFQTERTLEALLFFIEDRYREYLNMDERIPQSYLNVLREEVGGKMPALKLLIRKASASEKVAKLIISVMEKLLRGGNAGQKVTFKTAIYGKEFIAQLEKLQNAEMDEDEAFSKLDQLLIYMNFNSKVYIRLLSNYIDYQVSAVEGMNEKLDKLLYYQKSFNQLPKKPERILNPDYYDLTTMMENWFSEEIAYLEKISQLPEVPESKEVKKPGQIKKIGQKIMCMLSADQLGLIIRAADESRILTAKSMSEVFRTLVPHLSTPNRDNLSPEAVRVTTYKPEDRDKQIAIESLEKMIKVIKRYK